MTLTETQFLQIASSLMDIQTRYHRVLNMNASEADQKVFHALFLLYKNNPDSSVIKEALRFVKEHYPNGVDYAKTTLLSEAVKQLPSAYRLHLPADDFDRDVLLYSLQYLLLKEEFKNITRLPLGTKEKVMLDTLQDTLRLTLVENPNLKGSFPYYKQHHREFARFKTRAIEQLDNLFNSHISFFKGE